MDGSFFDRPILNSPYEYPTRWELDECGQPTARLRRKTRLGEKQRALLWTIFERVRTGLAAQGLMRIPASSLG
jgi:hypothetical protein